MLKGHDLAVPIYLDTNALLDVLASIEGGFTLVEKVRTRCTDSRTTEATADVGTEFGIPNVLNLLKIKLSASMGRASGQQSEEERQTERYHTYGSLLNGLRSSLDEHEALKRITDQESWDAASLLDFVEARGRFTVQPLLTGLRTIQGTAKVFSSIDRHLSSIQPSQRRPSRTRKGASRQSMLSRKRLLT